MFKLFKRIAVVFTGRMLARAAQFFVLIILGRSLGPSQFGWYVILTTSIILAAQLASLGLRQIATHQIGQKIQSTGQILSNILIVWPILAGVSSIAIIFMTGEIFSQSDHGSFAMLAISVAMFGALAIILMQGILLGNGRTSIFSLTDTLVPTTTLVVLGAIMLFGDLTFRSALIALALANVVSGLTAFFFAVQSSKLVAPNLPILSSMLTKGFIFSVNIFLIMLSTRIPVYLIENMSSSADAGLFFAGQRVGDMVGEAAVAVGMVLFSDTARAKDPSQKMKENVKIGAWVLWIFTAGSLLIIPFSEVIIKLAFGDGYYDAAAVLAITALAIGPAATTKIIYPTLSAFGRPIWGTPAILLSVITNIAMCWLLFPKYGLTGAAYALVLSQVVLLIGYAWILKRLFGIGFRDTLIPQRLSS